MTNFRWGKLFGFCSVCTGTLFGINPKFPRATFESYKVCFLSPLKCIHLNAWTYSLSCGQLQQLALLSFTEYLSLSQGIHFCKSTNNGKTMKNKERGGRQSQNGSRILQLPIEVIILFAEYLAPHGLYMQGHVSLCVQYSTTTFT